MSKKNTDYKISFQNIFDTVGIVAIFYAKKVKTH